MLITTKNFLRESEASIEQSRSYDTSICHSSLGIAARYLNDFISWLFVFFKSLKDISNYLETFWKICNHYS